MRLDVDVPEKRYRATRTVRLLGAYRGVIQHCGCGKIAEYYARVNFSRKAGCHRRGWIRVTITRRFCKWCGRLWMLKHGLRVPTTIDEEYGA